MEIASPLPIGKKETEKIARAVDDLLGVMTTTLNEQKPAMTVFEYMLTITHTIAYLIADMVKHAVEEDDQLIYLKNHVQLFTDILYSIYEQEGTIGYAVIMDEYGNVIRKDGSDETKPNQYN